jgi:hypothetical protein
MWYQEQRKREFIEKRKRDQEEKAQLEEEELKKKHEQEQAKELRRIQDEEKQKKKEEPDRIIKEKAEQEQNLKETQEKSATVAKPSEVIDLTKDEKQLDKTGVPIINESVFKEESPTDPVGKKKVEISDDNSEQDTQTKKTPLRPTMSKIKVH